MPRILTTFVQAAKATLLPLLGFGLLMPCVVVASPEDEARKLLLELRDALRLAGLSDKEVAHYLNINKGLCSKKLGGERPLSFSALALLPVDVKRWLAVRWVLRHGVPVEVAAGARLQRRALRMGLAAPSQKAGIA